MYLFIRKWSSVVPKKGTEPDELFLFFIGAKPKTKCFKKTEKCFEWLIWGHDKTAYKIVESNSRRKIKYVPQNQMNRIENEAT